jgi:hypothetical protein
MTEALGRSRSQRVTSIAFERLVGQAGNCGERHRLRMSVASTWFQKLNLPIRFYERHRHWAAEVLNLVSPHAASRGQSGNTSGSTMEGL